MWNGVLVSVCVYQTAIMVARNFSLQDLPYNRVLQVPDEEREFLALDELKPHQLTELGVAVTCASSSGGQQQQQQQLHQSATSHRTLAAGGGDGEVPNPVITTGGLLQNYHHHNVFYELGAATNSPSK